MYDIGMLESLFQVDCRLFLRSCWLVQWVCHPISVFNGWTELNGRRGYGIGASGVAAIYYLTWPSSPIRIRDELTPIIATHPEVSYAWLSHLFAISYSIFV
jgi:hypothetical protein